MKTSNQYTSGNTYRVGVAGILLLSCFFDAATFILNSKFWIFEINPIYTITKSAQIVLALKFIVVGLYGVLILKPEIIKSENVRYIVVIATLYAILFQILGGISNLQTIAANPAPSQAYSQAEGTKIYLSFALLQAVAPILMGTLSFWLFRKCDYYLEG
jgi:hypothetical protein